MWLALGALLYSAGEFLMIAKMHNRQSTLKSDPIEYFDDLESAWEDLGKPILEMLLWPFFIWN